MNCLYCKANLDCHDQIKGPGEDDDTPDPNDATVCLHCGGLMVFDEKLQLREPTKDEIEQMLGDIRVTAAISAIGKINRTSKQ